MPRVYDAVDLFWSAKGDIQISNGDILDTAYDPLRSLVQEMKTRASGDTGAWRNNTDIGSNISDFVGEPNNKVTAEGIKARIIASLARHGFINTNDLTIRYIPIAADKLIVRINVKVLPTQKNRGSKEVTITGLYNYEEDQVAFLI